MVLRNFFMKAVEILNKLKHITVQPYRQIIIELLPLLNKLLIIGALLAVLAPESFEHSLKALTTFEPFIIGTSDYLGWKRLSWPIQMTQR